MSAGEVCWRIAAIGRDQLDAVRLALRAFPSERDVPDSAAGLSAGPPVLCDLRPGEWRDAPPGSIEARWRDRLVSEADAIAAHRIRIFGHERDLGDPIDWNRDHASGTPAPLTFSPRIDYRDARRAGDAKIVWEPNRHQHLLVLARAYRATGERRYAEAVVAQIASWLDQCPFPYGMNWRSPLELAIRVLNWVWAIDYVRDAAVVPRTMHRRLLHAIHLHLWDVTRKFSRGSSANNHLIGEAAGVFVASRYFPELDPGGRMARESFAILCHEIQAQTHADGGTREQAIGYHLFVFQLLLAALAAGRATGQDFPPAFLSRLEKMVEFAGVLSEGGPLPMFGDADDGYAIDLGRGDSDLSGTLCAGAVLFGRADFKAWARGFAEPTRWLFGAEGEHRFHGIPLAAAAPALTSRALPETGYYLLQCGTAGGPDSISAVVDCAPLGFTAIAAHGHADALSVTVRAFGREILVDPGTYDYFTYPEWRRYLKSTPAHNTVTIDGVDQSVQLGSFLWGAHATCRCLEWRPAPDGGLVSGEHDGYTRLDDPVRHRRTVRLSMASRTLTVEDTLTMEGSHDVAVMFHLAEACAARPSGEGEWQIEAGAHRVFLSMDARLTTTVIRAGDAPGPGWVSRGYHHKCPSDSIAGVGRLAGTTVLTSRFQFAPGAE